MKKQYKYPLLGVLVLGMGLTSLSAQGAKAGDLRFEAKVRGGFVSGLKNELGDDKIMGLGVAGSYMLSAGTSVFAELNYLYLPGKDRDAMQARTFDGRVLSTASSAHNVKNSAEGFSLRGGYRAPFFKTGLDWQAGLSLDRLQSRQEVTGTLRPVGAAAATYEGLAYSPTSTKVVVGAFVGVRMDLNENFALEANVASIGFSQVNWVPRWYTGTAAHAETTNSKGGVALEVVFALRF